MTVATMGYTPDPDDLDRLQMDPAEALTLLSSLLRRYKKHHQALRIIKESEVAQLAEIREYSKEQASKEVAEMAELERQMRPLAALLLPYDPEGRKTVQTVAGDVSFHAGSTSIEVTDQASFYRWAETLILPWEWGLTHTIMREPPPPAPQPSKPALQELIRKGHAVVNDDGSLSLKGEDGERVPIPGVKFVRGEETFRVSPR